MLFNDTWSQQGNSVSCMTIILFLNLQISRPDIRPHIKVLWAWWMHVVTLVFLRGLRGYVWVNILTSSIRRVPTWDLFIYKIQVSLKSEPSWVECGGMTSALGNGIFKDVWDYKKTFNCPYYLQSTKSDAKSKAQSAWWLQVSLHRSSYKALCEHIHG